MDVISLVEVLRASGPADHPKVLTISSYWLGRSALIQQALVYNCRTKVASSACLPLWVLVFLFLASEEIPHFLTLC